MALIAATITITPIADLPREMANRTSNRLPACCTMRRARPLDRPGRGVFDIGTHYSSAAGVNGP